MSQTTNLSSSDKISKPVIRIRRSDLFDSIRHHLLVMEFRHIDRSDDIIQKLEQLKEYSINEA